MNKKYEALLNKGDKTEEEFLDEYEWKYLLKRLKKLLIINSPDIDLTK